MVKHTHSLTHTLLIQASSCIHDLHVPRDFLFSFVVVVVVVVPQGGAHREIRAQTGTQIDASSSQGFSASHTHRRMIYGRAREVRKSGWKWSAPR